MKTLKIIILLAVCVMTNHAYSQSVKYHSTEHYNKKVAAFEKMDAINDSSIVMIGNSLTEYAGDWSKLLKKKNVINRGIAGDDATGISHRLVQILPGKPKAIFLMLGINDILQGRSAQTVSAQCQKIIETIRRQSPETQVFFQSILPINETFEQMQDHEDASVVIRQVNAAMKKYCKQNDLVYIDLYSKFVRHGTHDLRRDMTQDGLHLNAFGYKVWAFQLNKYMNRL